MHVVLKTLNMENIYTAQKVISLRKMLAGKRSKQTSHITRVHCWHFQDELRHL